MIQPKDAAGTRTILNALVYRIDSCRWEGMADTDEPAVAQKYLEEFDELWNACAIEPTLRLMQL